MPGPNSRPTDDDGRVIGKTAKDRANGKAVRHEQNRAAKANDNREMSAGRFPAKGKR